MEAQDRLYRFSKCTSGDSCNPHPTLLCRPPHITRRTRMPDLTSKKWKTSSKTSPATGATGRTRLPPVQDALAFTECGPGCALAATSAQKQQHTYTQTRAQSHTYLVGLVNVGAPLKQQLDHLRNPQAQTVFNLNDGRQLNDKINSTSKSSTCRCPFWAAAVKPVLPFCGG